MAKAVTFTPPDLGRLFYDLPDQRGSVKRSATSYDTDKPIGRIENPDLDAFDVFSTRMRQHPINRKAF